MPYLHEATKGGGGGDESKEHLAPPQPASSHVHLSHHHHTPHEEPHLTVAHQSVHQYISSLSRPSASSAAAPHPPIQSVISSRYVTHVDTLSRCVLFANSDNPRLLAAHKRNKAHTEAYDDALMSAIRAASSQLAHQQPPPAAPAPEAEPQQGELVDGPLLSRALKDIKRRSGAEWDDEPNPFEQGDDTHTPSAHFHTRDSSAAPQHFTSAHTSPKPSTHTLDDLPSSAQRTPSHRLSMPPSSSTSELLPTTPPLSSPASARQADKERLSTPSHTKRPASTTPGGHLHVDPTASPRQSRRDANKTSQTNKQPAAPPATASTNDSPPVIEGNILPLPHQPGEASAEWTLGEQTALAEQILLMYVEVYWQNPKAFAPFYRGRVSSWRDKAALVYEHLVQSRHKESHLNRWKRQWSTRHIRKRLIALFERELIRLDTACADSTHPHHHLNHRQALLRREREAAMRASTSQRSTAAKSLRLPAESKSGEGRPSLHRSMTQAELSVPLTEKDKTTIPAPTDAYFSRLNEVCTALHARYVDVSRAVGDEIVARLLTPALPESIVDAAALNRAVIDVMHSPALLPSLLSYHPDYQNAALNFPGLILMSRSLRRQLECPSLEFDTLQLTDLISAVNELTEILRTAFHKLVAVQPQLLERLVASKRFNVLRTVTEAENEELQRERERGSEPYPGSFSFWLYDSQLYPRRFNNDSLNVLRHVNQRDSRVFYLVAAHRFEQAAKRLKQLGDTSKARWLELLIQRRKEETRNHMIGVSSTTRGELSSQHSHHHHHHSHDHTKPHDSSAVALRTPTHKSSFEQRSPATNPLASPHDTLLSPSSGGEEMEAAAAAGRGEIATDEYEDITTGRPEYFGAKLAGGLPKHTTYGHIHKWVDISAQYVVGMGRDLATGELEPWAVYDKTFNEPLFSDLWTTLQVGFMTRENIHDHQLALKRMKKAGTVQEFLTNVLFSSNATTSQSINVQADFFRDPLLIWRDGRQPADLSQPSRPVAFDDFDWLQMFISHPELQPLITCVADLNDLVNPRSIKRWPLHHCYFQRQEDGSYRLPLNRSKTIQPVKVVDLKFPKASFQPAVTRAVFTNAIKGGLSGIPFYGPTQTMSALLERVFDFTDILYLQRHFQAQMLVLEAIDGSDTSPFSHPLFTPAMLESATFYLLRTNIMLSGVIVNSVSDNAKLAVSYINKVDWKRQQAIELLQQRGFTVCPLPNSYYALTYKRDPATGLLTKLKLHSLGFRKIARNKKPHAAIDLFRPHRERRKRLVLQYLLTLMNFFYIPIPGVGGVVKMAYKEIFVREIHKRQMWENGLLAHMHHNAGQLARLLQTELRMQPAFAQHVEAQCLLILEERRLSPFDLTAEEMDRHRAIVEQWIRQHDPEYESLHPPNRDEKTEAKTHDSRPPDRTPAPNQPPEPNKRQFSRSALME